MFRNTFFSLTLALALIPTLHPTPVMAQISASCETTVPTTLLRGSDAHAEFRIEVPSTGVLSVEFSRRVRIDLTSSSCGDDADVLAVQRSTKHVRLATTGAGVVTLHVSRADGADGADGFLGASEFTPARAVVEHFDLDGMPARRTIFYKAANTPLVKTEPENADPDPNGLYVRGTRPLATFLTVELDLLDKTDPENADPDPNGLWTSEISDD